MNGGTIVEIHQLLGQYCHILDARAWDRLGEVFAPHAVLDARSIALGVHEGLPAIATFWKRAEHPLAHHVMAIVVEDRGDGTADVESKGLFAWPDGLSGGDYRDVAVRTGKGWRLARREYIRRWSLPCPGRPARAAPTVPR